MTRVCFRTSSFYEVPSYIAAQLLGSILASGTLCLLFQVEQEYFFGTVPKGRIGRNRHWNDDTRKCAYGREQSCEYPLPNSSNNSDSSEEEAEWSSPESSVKRRGPMLEKEPNDTEWPHDPTKAHEERYDDTPQRGTRDIKEVYERSTSPDMDEAELLLLDEEPRSYAEAKDEKNWQDAMRAEIASIEKNNTWILTDLPKGVKPIGLKWVFKTKKDAQGRITKHKARLVAKGYVQKYGIDYKEVFAPVARMETVRMILAVAAQRGWFVHHLDVKTAFLHGELREQVFVNQPDGFIKRGAEQKVYKLVKALYGLKQAPRAWNTKLDCVLQNMGFEKCKHEPTVYKRNQKGKTVIMGVYVDDLLITGECKEEINKVKKKMEENFEMTDLGLLNYYLGIEVKQGNQGISIVQAGYAAKILKETRMEHCNATSYPMEPGLKLSKNDEGPKVDPTLFRQWVGYLRYLTHTRPDICYSVGYVSRFMQAPSQSHMQAIKQILRYVKGTRKLGLTYQRNGSGRLCGYSNSSHSIDKDDGRSTTGILLLYNGTPVAWNSQKQGTVALSSCEAEFMAATSAACQAIWMQRLLAELLNEKEERVMLKVDNQSALALMKNPVFHGRSKHIDARYHFIRECVERNQIKVEHVKGTEQKADILTKALPRQKHAEMKKELKLEELQV
ncbi:hypothetical protein E3N88_03889 [Mikania micrantha]|uniref:Reverse transcriptase Ty1/copia-type domain-containing protein n=1 Tax=Mikania micrantha TaxID=192012 RepID=A0A5N6PV31_9ASTR|nr:hypothetical protein E3N88_03889 [Mikania micrantha]